MEILVPTRVELNLLNYKSKSVFILIAKDENLLNLFTKRSSTASPAIGKRILKSNSKGGCLEPLKIHVLELCINSTKNY